MAVHTGHAEVREPPEEQRERQLQQLYRLKLPAQDQDLPENQNAIPKNQPDAQGQGGELAAQDIGRRRDRRDAERCVFCYSDAEGGKEQTDDE